MAKIYLSALTARIMDMAQRNEVDLLELLSQIAEWTKLSDIDYELATVDNLCQIIERFAVLCGVGEGAGDFNAMVNAIVATSPVMLKRRVL